MTFDRTHLEHLGFVGFLPAPDLRVDRCSDIPASPGVYAVVRSSNLEPRFRARSVGGHFKSVDPTVPVAELRQKWVADSPVLYIGMAGTSLRTRVRALVEYAGGKPVGHQGGRYLWQVD